MFDYLTKTSIINLKEFTVDTTFWLGIESFLENTLYTVSRPLRRRNLYHLFITDILLVWPVGHTHPHVTNWVTSNLPTWM